MDAEESLESMLLVMLGSGHGTLTLATAAGLRFMSGQTATLFGAVSFDGSASFYTSEANANRALANLTYRPHADWHGNDTLWVTADDRGWSGEVRYPNRLAEAILRPKGRGGLVNCVCLPRHRAAHASFTVQFLSWNRWRSTLLA